MVTIRPATPQDAPIIQRMVRAARLDPSSLNWRNFLIAETDGQVIGIGQVKPLLGCSELGSLVVAKPYRHRGIARKLIVALEERSGLPLYLLCAHHLEPFYRQFGFQRITWRQTPISLRLKLTFAWLFRLAGIQVIAMEKRA